MDGEGSHWQQCWAEHGHHPGPPPQEGSGRAAGTHWTFTNLSPCLQTNQLALSNCQEPRKCQKQLEKQRNRDRVLEKTIHWKITPLTTPELVARRRCFHQDEPAVTCVNFPVKPRQRFGSLGTPREDTTRGTRHVLLTGPHAWEHF